MGDNKDVDLGIVVQDVDDLMGDLSEKARDMLITLLTRHDQDAVIEMYREITELCKGRQRINFIIALAFLEMSLFTDSEMKPEISHQDFKEAFTALVALLGEGHNLSSILGSAGVAALSSIVDRGPVGVA